MVAERRCNSTVQAGIAANAQSIPHRKIMIAENRINAVRRLESADRLGGTCDVPVSFVNEIARHGDQIGLFGASCFNRLIDVRLRHLRATVQIRELNDFEAVERCRQTGNGNVVNVAFEPDRFDAIAVTNPCPSAAQPVGPSADRISEVQNGWRIRK